jgi:hypothetical protein
MRARVPPESKPAGSRPAPRQASLRGAPIGLHRSMGNRAMGRLARVLQRQVGWTDAVTDGYGWNKRETSRGAIRRIPLEGLPVGLPKDAPIRNLTTESAERRAVVLLPKALDATQEVEYLIFLHGHTENSKTRPFAGWRAYKAPKKKPEDNAETVRLRKGIDATDVAPVRDVALDQAEDQLEDSGLEQLVILLPQGGLFSQFGDAGDKNFDAANYVDKIAARLLTERCWVDAEGRPVSDKPPKRGRVTMAGHSGAGATLSNMANEAVRLINPGDKELPASVPSSPLTGDLVIFDAINGDKQYKAFKRWVQTRLNEDLKVLTGGGDDQRKLKYLQSAPKLRGFFTDLYKDPYTDLENVIRAWFSKHAAELGPFARCLRQNFMLTHVDSSHEELMRGIGSGKTRRHGVLEALKDLHRPLSKDPADCPKMPEELEEEERRRKREELRERRERARERRTAPAKAKTAG